MCGNQREEQGAWSKERGVPPHAPCSMPPAPSLDVNVLTLRKGAHTWMLMYLDRDRPAALSQLGRWASSPELNFTWFDAAVLAQKIRSAGNKGTRE